MLKAAAVLDPDVWPKDQIELSTYGDAEIELLANYYEDHLLRAGCELHQIVHGSYRFDDLLFKDFSRTFQGLLIIFKESIPTGTISHFFYSHSKKAIPVRTNKVVQPKDRIL